MDRKDAQQAAFSTATLAMMAAVTALAALRLCHIHLLWADEDYHLAAAVELLHGKVPYRDFWYDKPPLNTLVYLAVGGYWGWPLRLLDTGYVVFACLLMYRLARAWWSEREGRVAALLLAFFLTFYLPSAVIAFAADAWMLGPHIAAIYYAYQKRPFICGCWCAAAFLVNAKALFVMAVCALWLYPQIPLFCGGVLLPLGAAGGVAIATGSMACYWEQVWRWGWIYARGSPVEHPLVTGLIRTLDWLGFHAALAGGAIVATINGSRKERWLLGSWLALSFAAVCVGTRFAPHYFLQLLPAMVMAGSHGLVIAWDRYGRPAMILAALALAVPFVRFGPRYVSLAYDNLRGEPTNWRDTVMDRDAQQAARIINGRVEANDSLFVWGYRPDVYVYTRLASDGKFWDSQPLTGVPADRHLQVTQAIYGGPAAQNRQELARSRPTWIVDGLGPLNPRLAPERFPELRSWLAQYRVVGRTGLSVIYRRQE
jgi:hypothetical protein